LKIQPINIQADLWNHYLQFLFTVNFLKKTLQLILSILPCRFLLQMIEGQHGDRILFMIVIMYMKGNTLVTMMKKKYCINTYYLYYENHEVAQTTIVFEKEIRR